jgi:hypothetical protein
MLRDYDDQENYMVGTEIRLTTSSLFIQDGKSAKTPQNCGKSAGVAQFSTAKFSCSCSHHHENESAQGQMWLNWPKGAGWQKKRLIHMFNRVEGLEAVIN